MRQLTSISSPRVEPSGGTAPARPLPHDHGTARGVLAAALCVPLSVFGHAGAGGALPDLGLLLVLVAPLTGLLIAVARRHRGPLAILVTLAGAQLGLHGLLQLLGTHHHASPSDPVLMAGAHALVTMLTALVMAGAESGAGAVAGALRWLLARVQPMPLTWSATCADRPIGALVVRAGPPHTRLRDAAFRWHRRRGPPARCH